MYRVGIVWSLCILSEMLLSLIYLYVVILGYYTTSIFGSVEVVYYLHVYFGPCSS